MKVYFFTGRPTSQNHLICVNLRLRLIPISRAQKLLVLCHVVCDTWWLCELSSKKNKYKCIVNVILISRMPSIRCVSVQGPYAYVTFYVNWMVFFLSQWIRPCKIHAGKVTCAPFHPWVHLFIFQWQYFFSVILISISDVWTLFKCPELWNCSLIFSFFL